MSIAHYFHWDEATEGNFAFRKEPFLVRMLYAVRPLALEIIIHRGWKENTAVREAPECIGAEVKCLS